MTVHVRLDEEGARELARLARAEACRLSLERVRRRPVPEERVTRLFCAAERLVEAIAEAARRCPDCGGLGWVRSAAWGAFYLDPEVQTLIDQDVESAWREVERRRAHTTRQLGPELVPCACRGGVESADGDEWGQVPEEVPA